MSGGRPNRRAFLRASLLAAAGGLTPTLSWADAGAPDYLAAAQTPSGAYALFGLDAAGEIRFEVASPGRGHAAAAHPSEPLAVAFARRPGTFALVIDCAVGRPRARLTAPAGRHFYGHGAFDAEGARLYTCENAYETGEGRIGVWDARDGFRRIGEFASGGVGPHELVFDAARARLVVANGGVRTHPESGRAKLNLPMMRPNLAYIDPIEGAARRIVEPPEALRFCSIRHLALRADGLVAIAMQWQGALFDPAPLLALHRFGEEELRLLSAPAPQQLGMRGYGGSVAFSETGARVGLTSPRGGRLQIFDAASGAFEAERLAPDICGLAGRGGGFLATDGGGGILTVEGKMIDRRFHRLSWDNHLISLRRTA
ncbi:MAG: DUF1513 domain-containing protein [Pseudomonadota bacterium]